MTYESAAETKVERRKAQAPCPYQRRLTDSEQSELRVKGPMGIDFFFKGQYQTLLFVVLALIVIAVGFWKFYEHSELTAAGLAKNTEALYSVVYVLTLTQENREKLNLQEPAQIGQLRRNAR